jgi:hypothetical protein
LRRDVRLNHRALANLRDDDPYLDQRQGERTDVQKKMKRGGQMKRRKYG